MVYVLYDKLGNWLIKLQDSIHFGIEFSDSEESPIFSIVNFKTIRSAMLCGIPPMMLNFASVCRRFSTRGGIPVPIYNVA